MAKAVQPLNIALIADSPLQQHLLRSELEAQGHRVLVNITPQRFDAELLTRTVDVWLVELADLDRAEHLIEQLLDQVPVPVLFGGGQIPERGSEECARWLRKLQRKLEGITPSTGFDNPDQPCEPPPLELPPVCRREPLDQVPERVWVLGASMGGPVAVRAFLAALPAGLPVAFVYAQHIDPGHGEVLAKGLNRFAQLRVRVAEPGARLRYGEVMILPVDEEVRFSESATLEYCGTPWQGAYQPSIDHVMDNLLARFGQGCGALVFSGMGEDGTRAAAAYVARGLPVWTQSAESCVNSTMPEAIRQAGCARFTGAPEELARRLVAWIADDVRLRGARIDELKHDGTTD